MDRNRLRIAFTMTCLMSVYLMTSRNSVRGNSSPTSETRSISYECVANSEKSLNDLLHFTLQTTVKGVYNIKAQHYKGKWESDPYDVIFAENLTYKDRPNILESNGTYFDIRPGNLASKTAHGNISVQLSSDKTKIESNISYDNSEFLSIKGELLNYDKIQFSRLYYSFIISIIYLFTISALAKHFQKCFLNESFAAKTSLYTLGMLELYELIFALWQIKRVFESRTSRGLDFLLISSFWSFSSFMFIHSKILPVVYKAQNTHLNTFGFYVSSRIIANYQSRVFLLCVIAIILANTLSSFYVITISLLHLIFLPQIIVNSTKGYKDSFEMSCVCGLLGSKFVIILYLAGCPMNFMRYEPNYQLCFNVFAVIAVQIAIISHQRLRPRFLVPKRFRPLQYEYFRDKDDECKLALDTDNTCIICMTILNVENNEQEIIYNHSKTMHTPCSHRFHQDCLVQWMNIKLECPTCRSKIPAFEE